MEDAPAAADARLLAASLKQLPEPELKPTFVVVSGLPGTGKSHFCRKLAERSPFAILESDALRKTIFPSPAYTAEESARLFRAIHQLVEWLLEKGIPVILDATNLSEQNRGRLYNIAERLEVRLILVNVMAPPELVQERLASREAQKKPGDKSDADWVVYQMMKPRVEKINRKHYVVDTSQNIAPVLDKIVREIRKGA